MKFTRCESCGRRLGLMKAAPRSGMSAYCNACYRDLVNSDDSMLRNYRGSSPERIFAACLRVVASEGWQIRHTDPATMTVSFAAKGRKIRIGGGIEMSAFVAKRDDDTVRVSVGASPAGLQALRLFDHGEKDEVFGLFFERLRDVLPTIDEPEPQGGMQSLSAVDELERLALLHERGALDDDEFRRAKQQLLGE